MHHIFRVATTEDLNSIIEFLSLHWSKEHVFVRCPELLEWQHQTPGSDTLNFMLAINSSSGRIDSLMGFIPTYRFDSQLKQQKDYWGAIWKNGKNHGLVGLQLLLEFQKQLAVETYAGIGLSAEARKVYRALGYSVGEMEHYFIPNPHVSQKICSAPLSDLPNQISPSATLRKITTDELLNSKIKSRSFPKKTPRYLWERYVTHPVYSYQLYQVEIDDLPIALIVTRIDTVKELNASCLHIVDWFGSWKESMDLREAIQSLLVELGCEYCDMVCRVEEERHFVQLGFRLKEADTETIPLYFSPFCKKNIPLHYVVTTSHPSFCFFKGDADQDRPNHCIG